MLHAYTSRISFSGESNIQLYDDDNPHTHMCERWLTQRKLSLQKGHKNRYIEIFIFFSVLRVRRSERLGDERWQTYQAQQYSLGWQTAGQFYLCPWIHLLRLMPKGLPVVDESWVSTRIYRGRELVLITFHTTRLRGLYRMQQVAHQAWNKSLQTI